MFILQSKGLDMNTLYSNSDSHTVGAGGGQTAVLAIAATAVGQGNAGTSLPCRVAYVTALCASELHMGLSSSTDLTGAMLVPTAALASLHTAAPIEMAIDDVSKLYFYAGTAASVFITYRF